jgi:curli biogenesis system outer membrane secretion channel CsgG
MERKLLAGLSAMALLGFAYPAAAQVNRPPVAVMDFDYGTVDNWWGQYNIGKGMADQVVDALVNDGSFRVIERKKLDTVLAEQDFSASDRAAPSAAKMSKIGHVLGIKYIITGSITKFSTEKHNVGGSVHGFGLGVGKAKSEVNLTARLVDTTTGEIVMSAKGHGESNKGGGLAVGAGGNGFSMGSPEFRQSALGDAQEAACNDIVKQLVAKKDRLQ